MASAESVHADRQLAAGPTASLRAIIMLQQRMQLVRTWMQPAAQRSAGYGSKHSLCSQPGPDDALYVNAYRLLHDALRDGTLSLWDELDHREPSSLQIS